MEENDTITVKRDELLMLIASAVRSALEDAPPKAGRSGGGFSARKKKMLSPKDIQEEFGIHWRSLLRWRNAGIGPAYTNVGRRVFYDRRVFEQFLAAGQVQTTGFVG